MRENTPDHPTPEQEQNENQTQQREEQQPLSPQANEAPAATSDAPTPAPGQEEASAKPASDAGLGRDQEIPQTKETAETAAQPFAPETDVAVEEPLSMQPEAAQTQSEIPLQQDTVWGGADQDHQPEAASEQAAAQTPEQTPEQKATPSLTAEDIPTPSKCFGALSWITPLLLALLAVALFAPLAYNSKITGLEARPGVSPQLAAAVETAEQGGDLSFWFIPQAAGQPSLEVLPLELWWGAASNALSRCLSDLTGAWVGGWIVPLTLVWLFLMAAASLGWSDSRFGRRAGLAAGLTVFCGPLFMAVAWFAPNLLLAPTLSALAAACLLRGLKKTAFSLTVFLGCIFMALAGLAGGLIPMALPLAAALFVIIGTLNFRRLGEWDLVFGLGLTLLILGGWLTGGLLFAGSTALRAYLAGLPLLSGGGSPLPIMPWACFALLTLVVLLPWPILPLCLPARSGKALLAGVKDWKNRTGFTEPLFLAGLLIAGLAGLMAADSAGPALLLLLPAALAALTARTITNLTAKQNRRWGSFCALYLLAMALVFAWLLLDSGREFLNAQLSIAANISFGIKTWLAPGAAALIGALTIWFFGRGKSSQSGLLVFAFALLLVSQAFAWISLPVLEPYLRTSRIQPDLPVLDIVSPEQTPSPDGPRLHLPMPPEPGVITPPATAVYNATQSTPPQLNILGAPMPTQHNATSPNSLPTMIMPVAGNATGTAPDIGLGGEAATPPLAQNATAPVPEAGGALYGDDLPALETPTGPPPTPYQPGLHTQTKEPPLPVLDTPPAQPAPRAPLTDPYPPRNTN